MSQRDQEDANSELVQSTISLSRPKSISHQRKSVLFVHQEVAKQSQSIFLTRAFVEKPCLVIAFFLLVFIACVVVFIFEPAQIADGTHRDYLIWEDKRVKDFDMLSKVGQYFQDNKGDEDIPVQSQEQVLWNTDIILYCEDCSNVLTKQNLGYLKEMENYILNHKYYKNFCLATVTSSDCGPEAYNYIFTDGEVTSQKSIDKIVNLLAEDETVLNKYKNLIGIDFNYFKEKKTRLVRSVFKFGSPLNIKGTRYKSFDDRKQEQINHFKDFSQDIIDKREELMNKIKNGASILPYNFQIQQIEFQKEVNKDLMWAIASIAFVWFYISLNLGSIFLGTFAIFDIIVSFPITFLLYRYVFQITYFSTLHILAVFLVLGIAADDIFIFMDAWYQTKHYETIKNDPNKRMAFTFRRSAKAMLATSSTTSAAFIATGLSDIMPISAFGFFAGILIPVNFLLVVTFFPALMMVQEKYLSNLCCKKKKEDDYKDNDPSNSALRKSTNKPVTQSQFGVGNTQINFTASQKLIQGSFLEKFLFNHYNSFIFKARYVIIFLVVCWTGVACWRGFQISPLTEPEEFMPDDHYAQLGQKISLGGFQQSAQNSQGIKVAIIWGLKGLNKEGVSKWDPLSLGKLEWDDEFDITTEKNQEAMVKICQDLKKSPVVLDEDVVCPMEYFAMSLQLQGFPFPVPQDQFIAQFEYFMKHPEGGLDLYNNNFVGLIDGKVRFMMIIASSIGEPFRPYSETYPLYEDWEETMQDINRHAPKGLNKGIQSAGFYWSWMMSEKAFIDNAIKGMSISLVFSLFVLFVFTANWIISLFSIFCIGGIVISVVAIMELQGWELGIAESMTIVILIGLSVDYVVHLANHYIECPFKDRYRRTQISIKEIGVSILSGAVTTEGAGVFLFFGSVLVFNKFALLIVATISFSLLYSMVFFTALMHSFGPEDESGNINYSKCFPCLYKKKNSNLNNSTIMKQKNNIADSEIVQQKAIRNSSKNLQNIDQNAGDQQMVKMKNSAATTNNSSPFRQQYENNQDSVLTPTQNNNNIMKSNDSADDLEVQEEDLGVGGFKSGLKQPMNTKSVHNINQKQ